MPFARVLDRSSGRPLLDKALREPALHLQKTLVILVTTEGQEFQALKIGELPGEKTATFGDFLEKEGISVVKRGKVEAAAGKDTLETFQHFAVAGQGETFPLPLCSQR